MTGKTQLWQIANTTIRNPYRLKPGLQALIDAGFEGSMGRDRELAMSHALRDHGIVTLSPRNDKDPSIARKWRSGLIKMGFLWSDLDISEEAGHTPYSLTPNGIRLLESDTIMAEQETILRSVSALHIPSPLERRFDCQQFSPLVHVISILRSLELSLAVPYLGKLEMASVVMLSNPEKDVNSIVAEILDLRSRRERAPSKKKFDSVEYENVAIATKYAPDTFRDYQDVVFRYLRATGLFQTSKNGGIALAPARKDFAYALADTSVAPVGDIEYLEQLAFGAQLPTDSLETAQRDLDSLALEAKRLGITYLPGEQLASVADISIQRYRLLDLISNQKELEYARLQSEQIREILTYLRVLETSRPVEHEGSTISIPKAERPAYFEWILWRVILALGEHELSPTEMRNFRVDQDFFPVSTAPGGSAEIIAKYEKAVLVVEVTMSEGVRQEAMEGAPVRHHVALEEYSNEATGKDVYGLFIAPTINSNTAETFRVGTWYNADDRKLRLRIAPFTIKQLRTLLETQYGHDRELSLSKVMDVVKKILELRDVSEDGPEWKAKIDQVLSDGDN